MAICRLLAIVVQKIVGQVRHQAITVIISSSSIINPRCRRETQSQYTHTILVAVGTLFFKISIVGSIIIEPLS